MIRAMSTRREQVLDAAVELLAVRGLRALTHRGVDETAGLPAGSASNHFRTRKALLHGVSAHLVARDERAVLALAGRRSPADVRELAEAVASLLRHRLGAGRPVALARRVLTAEAATDPELCADLRRCHPLRPVTAGWLRGVGSAEPDRHAELLLAFADGLLEQRLLEADRDGDLADDVEPLLRGLLS
ncbi:TetR family transcriptional regulator [Saccharopolyspora erythraea NRRL 2338]|uniref:TetR/AcrR family transcriptional regulator n=2 Tax=Saccharopolyspora erythraea TaxID=1836 RepID=A0ABP3MIY9_SACER|nr:TetR family transcriptional regulator [Saccharopolyspora erythraea D]PFG95088.1 TetR family transcriptional regulator [Saccharopolyspora erythraea NRRL 2338]